VNKSVYRVHGMMQSYFTRKMTGYLDYKGIPWLFRRFPGVSPESAAAGFPGGVPVVETPLGEFMWDSTRMIHHLEVRFPEPAVLPADPVLRFLCYVVEDAADEWLYRPAVGTRWFFAGECRRRRLRAGARHRRQDAAPVRPGARRRRRPRAEQLSTTRCHGGHDPALGRRRPAPVASRPRRASRPTPYLFGERPSLADFALFGGNAAHFTNDPLCRRWTDEDAPAVVAHTHRLLEPEDQRFGDWDASPSDGLLALLAELGTRYLPG
jgi:glutathione S-transferase